MRSLLPSRRAFVADPVGLDDRSVVLLLSPRGVAELLAASLKDVGCQVMVADDLAAAQELASVFTPALVVLDVDRYSSAGLRWLLASDGGARPSSRCLLLQGSSTACADATAVGALGATVLLKPVATAPFVQAVLNTLKQAQANPAPTGPALRWPDLRVDREMPVVEARRGDRWQLLHLAPTQHRLLIALLEGEGRVLPRAGLQAQVWLDQPLGTRTIDQAVRRLRAVLAGVGLQSLVQTVRNGGYRCDLTALAGKPPLGKATERKPRAQEASLRVNAP